MSYDALIRASSLTTYPDCELRFAAKAVPDLIEAAGYTLRRTYGSIGGKIGTATHSGAAHLLQHKIDHGDTGSVDDALDVAIDSLRTEVSEGAVWDDATPTMNEAEKQTGRMVAAYNIFIAPKIKPVAVELEMVARFSPTLRLIGHMDVAEDEEIHDTKTGRVRRPNHPQYGAYALLRRTHGAKANRFVEDYVPRTPVKRVQAAPETIEYPVIACEQVATRILKRIDAAVQEFSKSGEPDVFLANPSSQLCSAKYCPAHGSGLCKFHL